MHAELSASICTAVSTSACAENPGSVGHKHGPKIGTVFQAQNWDRVRKRCKESGPDSGTKKMLQLSAVELVFGSPSHAVVLPSTAV